MTLQNNRLMITKAAVNVPRETYAKNSLLRFADKMPDELSHCVAPKNNNTAAKTAITWSKKSEPLTSSSQSSNDGEAECQI